MFYSKTPVLLVSGGKGGVGKSSVSAGLANAIARLGAHVGLLDADINGPSQSFLFAGQMTAESTLLRPVRHGNVAVCSMGYLSENPSALVWSDDAARSLFSRLLFQTEWGAIDLLIIDLPPTSGVITRLLMKHIEHADTVFVTTASHLALADCRRDLTFHRRFENNALGIIHNMAYMECRECGKRMPIGEIEFLNTLSRETGIPVLARLPYDIGIADGLTLGDAAKTLAAKLGI